jgi:hypothetical protein
MFLLFFLAMHSGVQDVNECGLSLPTEIGEWKAAEEETSYDRGTLYDYMNGGAEVYLSFDYKRVCVRKFLGPDDNEIALDVYDMGSSAEAFGVFSVSIEDPEVGIGQGSEFGAGLLKFWKDKYFVSIVNLGIDESADQVLLEVGRAVDAAIETTGPKPEMLRLLPPGGLSQRQTSFFHSNVILSNRFFIAAENILKLTDQTNCVFGEYGEMGDAGNLLLVQYPDVRQAEEALREFFAAYLPEAEESRPYQTESGNWTSANRTDNYISVVFEAPSEGRAIELQSSIEFN